MSATLAQARRRHPSARWPAPVDALTHRVAQLLDLNGARHADVAAAVLQARGRTGIDRDEFARRLGLDADVLGRAEAGEISASRLPAALRRMVTSG